MSIDESLLKQATDTALEIVGGYNDPHDDRAYKAMREEVRDGIIRIATTHATSAVREALEGLLLTADRFGDRIGILDARHTLDALTPKGDSNG